jgi:hypothetical protein
MVFSAPLHLFTRAPLSILPVYCVLCLAVFLTRNPYKNSQAQNALNRQNGGALHFKAAAWSFSCPIFDPPHMPTRLKKLGTPPHSQNTKAPHHCLSLFLCFVLQSSATALQKRLTTQKCQRTCHPLKFLCHVRLSFCRASLPPPRPPALTLQAFAKGLILAFAG